jgi:hypothetical protein
MKEGTYVVVLSRGDVDHACVVAVCQDINGKSSCVACRSSCRS